MTIEQIERLNLGITPIDVKTQIIIESGLEWLRENTTIDVDIEEPTDKLPSVAKLFLIKFYEIQTLSTGVSSESIEGMSQSFDNTDKNVLIWQIAESLLYPYLKSRVRFVSAKKRWK